MVGRDSKKSVSQSLKNVKENISRNLEEDSRKVMETLFELEKRTLFKKKFIFFHHFLKFFIYFFGCSTRLVRS